MRMARYSTTTENLISQMARVTAKNTTSARVILALRCGRPSLVPFGAGICWDQWFPELARSLALHGAEAIFYPTAIGSEPQDPTLDSRDHWQRTMQGHSAANLVPVIASNRVGTEVDDGIETTFYGSSFITGHTGGKLAEAPREGEAIIYAEVDLAATAQARHSWGTIPRPSTRSVRQCRQTGGIRRHYAAINHASTRWLLLSG